MQLTALTAAFTLTIALLAPPAEPDDGGSTLSLATRDHADRPRRRPAPRDRPRRVAGDAEARESMYVDSDSTTVSTTAVHTTLGARDESVTARAGYSVDIVSSASVDVVSMASTRWTEVRNQGDLGITFHHGPWAIDADYVLSDERDWTSNTASAAVGRDFNERNTNVTLGYVFVHNQIFDARDAGFRERLLTNAANVSLTQVLGRRTTSRLAGFYGHNAGLQSSVYREVPIGVDPRTRCKNNPDCVPEVVPDRRHRFALAGTLAHALPTRRPTALLSSYRFYGDDWQVFSHTLELQLRADLHRHWLLRLQSRTYFQDAASFYQASYAKPQRFMTVDRELSTFIHSLTGLKLTYRAGRLGGLADLRFDVKADFSYFHFFDFPRLPLRLALVTEVGLRLVF